MSSSEPADPLNVPEIVFSVAMGALFPHSLTWGARWALRRGPRGLLVYVAWLFTFQIVGREVIMPWGRRIEQRMGELERRLGRKPTYEEYTERFGRSA